jgi:hypothetical protein
LFFENTFRAFLIFILPTGKAHEYGQHGRAERATVIRHADNLKLEGKMESRADLNQTFVLQQKTKATAATRQEMGQRQEATTSTITARERGASMARTEEGSVSGRIQEASTSKKMHASTSSLQVAATSAASESSRRQQVSSGAVVAAAAGRETEISSSSVAASASRVASSIQQQQQETAGISSRTNISTAVAGALVQTASTEAASISAVKTDKFASSLRESSSTSAVTSFGQQKEMSVIEHHRKQSLQKQQQQQRAEISSGWSGYEVAGHTGRTAAYGGRDYEYSSSLVGRRSAGGVGATSGAWAEHGSRSVGASPDYSSRSTGAVGYSTGQHQHQEYSARSSSAAAAGYQSRSAAATASSSAFRQESSSSAAAYQSTTQQSYRLHAQQVSGTC